MILTDLVPIAFLLVPRWVFAFVLFLVAGLLWLLRWPGTTTAKNKMIPVRASKFATELIPHNIDTIVIGSGSGGCACANILAQSGQRVLMLEQHSERTGGCTHTFRLEGCEWDTGLHYTSEGMSLETHRAGALLKFMTQGKQEWHRLDDPYDEVLIPSDQQGAGGSPRKYKHYEFNTGYDNVIRSLLERIELPNDDQVLRDDLKAKCQVWMDLCEEINDGFTALGMSRVVPRILTKFFLQKRIDKLYKLAAFTVRDVQYAVFNLGYSIDKLLSTEDCPKAPTGNEPDPILRRIKAVLTHPIGDYAVQPRVATFAAQAITMAHYSQGAAYTVGPTQNLSIRESSLLRQMGGDVLIDATVENITIENGRAVGVVVRNTSAGPHSPQTEIRAKNVVCATSIFNLCNTLLPKDHPVVEEFHDPTKRSIEVSNGHVFLFCKIKGAADELKLPKHNLWYFNGYDLDDAFDKYYKDPVNHRPPTVYIGFPCTKDTTWPKRYPNISNCILISDGLWDWFSKWTNTEVHDRGLQYEQFKNQLAKHLLEILYETIPQVNGKVEYWTLGTPLTEATYLHSYCGGSYGTKCDTNIFNKSNDRWTTTPYTSIPNLYMAGSDAFLPAVCGAMYGGILGASAILGNIGTLKFVLAFLGEFATYLQDDNPKLSRFQAYCLATKKFLTEKVAN